MSTAWVYKFDGTVQCDATSKGLTPEEMQPALVRLVGEVNVLSARKDMLHMIKLCGMPSGAINAYELTGVGFDILLHGISGDGGFKPLAANKAKFLATEVNVGELIGSLTARTPTAIAELPGHPIRVYRTGEGLTKDWRPDRCNVETDQQGTIVNVWFG